MSAPGIRRAGDAQPFTFHAPPYQRDLRVPLGIQTCTTPLKILKNNSSFDATVLCSPTNCQKSLSAGRKHNNNSACWQLIYVRMTTSRHFSWQDIEQQQRCFRGTCVMTANLDRKWCRLHSPPFHIFHLTTPDLHNSRIFF